METQYTLKNNYISVGNYYGGTQTFFKDDKGFLNKLRNKGGCGIVAITDVTLYLLKRFKVETKEEYKKLFKRTSRKALWLPNPWGMNFVQEVYGLKRMLKSSGINLKCSWCFDRKNLYERIVKMITNDTPVILCIPRSLGFVKRNKDLNLYDSNLRVAAATNGHFVVVTGIYYDKNTGREFYKISSWGKQYYINIKEYQNFYKSHIMHILGNMMYIGDIKNGR